MLNVGCGSGLRGRGVVYREMSEGVQETEQEDWNRGMRQETEQVDCKLRGESGNTKQNRRISSREISQEKGNRTGKI